MEKFSVKRFCQMLKFEYAHNNIFLWAMISLFAYCLLVQILKAFGIGENISFLNISPVYLISWLVIWTIILIISNFDAIKNKLFSSSYFLLPSTMEEKFFSKLVICFFLPMILIIIVSLMVLNTNYQTLGITESQIEFLKYLMPFYFGFLFLLISLLIFSLQILNKSYIIYVVFVLAFGSILLTPFNFDHVMENQQMLLPYKYSILWGGISFVLIGALLIYFAYKVFSNYQISK